MATFLRAFGRFFTKHPLAGNGLVYGTLYVGAEFSQQTITRKLLVRIDCFGCVSASKLVYSTYLAICLFTLLD